MTGIHLPLQNTTKPSASGILLISSAKNTSKIKSTTVAASMFMKNSSTTKLKLKNKPGKQ